MAARTLSAAFFSSATLALTCCSIAVAQELLPERVTFMSLDGRTTLVGYVFAPRGRSGQAPAVVMMHGRAGAYSSAASGRYDSSTLSQRHRMWGQLWSAHGYLAVLIDGFGPRGYPQGFPRFSYDERPEELNEVTVRPLDAYGGLNYLRTRRDVIAGQIGLQGWSNGGSAALATMAVPATATPAADMHAARSGFRAALAFYPGCGLKGAFDESGYRPYAPILVLQGDADEEVSPKRCLALVERSQARGGDMEIKLYPGASHDFDDPGRKRQSIEDNVAARVDALERAQMFFSREVEGHQAK